jgi:starch synthase (maltosyl-transferring)
VRAALAATLCASWGVYGPAFELMERLPAKPGSEEYLNSEKYQIRAWDLDRPDSLAPLLAALNRARRENPALQQDRTLRFHDCDNPAIVCYSKTAGENAIVVAANTDPHQAQWGAIHLDTGALGIAGDRPYQMHDLLTGVRYRWQGRTNVVGLDPAIGPVHVFRLRRHQRTEADFEYFL